MAALWNVWHNHVKEYFSELHGHQSKTLAWFVLGAIKAQSLVVSRVAEALLAESEAKAPSIERRLSRFLSNERFSTEKTWDHWIVRILHFFRQAPIRLVIDVTSYEEHAQIIYVGILQHSRVLPLAWKVMPGQTTWDQGFWECIEELFERLLPHLGETKVTLLGDSAFGCFPMVQFCRKYRWHYLLRINSYHTCQRQSDQGTLLPTGPVSQLVATPGKRFAGVVRLWKDTSIETNISAYWSPSEEEPLIVISDGPAGGKRLQEYRMRFRVESTFQDLKSRGWDWEASHIRHLDRINRLLLVLFLVVWWLTHLAASCIRHGQRSRYDRQDRRDKGIFRLGRLYILDIERRASRSSDLINCLMFRRRSGEWLFSLYF